MSSLLRQQQEANKADFAVWNESAQAVKTKAPPVQYDVGTEVILAAMNDAGIKPAAAGEPAIAIADFPKFCNALLQRLKATRQ